MSKLVTDSVHIFMHIVSRHRRDRELALSPLGINPVIALFQPLSGPCTRSHIAVDLVSGLTAAEWNTVILAIGDRFSKLKDSQRVISKYHVFVPDNIVLDCSPQFISQV